MSKRVRLSVITPTYQNETYIAQVVKEIYKDVIRPFKGSCELIVYESGSTDKTRSILIDLQKKFSFKLIKTPKRMGYISQVKKLYNLAQGETIFFLDSDGECPPKEFWKLFKLFEKGKHDIVTGVRKNRRPKYRLIITKIDHFLMRILFDIKFKDANCGFRIVNKKAAQKIMKGWGKLEYNSNAEQLLIAKKNNLRIGEAKVFHRPRKSVVSPLKKMIDQTLNASLELLLYK